MKKGTLLREKLSYKVDSVMSKGTFALIVLLAGITVVVAVIAGVATLIAAPHSSNSSVMQSAWRSFVLTLDAGNLAGVQGNTGTIAIAAIVTLCGIFITSTLIGIINSGLSIRLDNLRKGTSKVIESNHTIVFGFNENLYTILSELCIANENQNKSCVVIMGNEEKQIMEGKINDRICNPKRTKIICRNGNTSSTIDLLKCSIETCKAIIINENNDFLTIKAILAITNILNSENCNECKASITAVIRDDKNIQMARMSGQGRVEILYFESVISRLMAHVCYQPGLSEVYTDLFNFAGDEIYIEKFPELVGKKFGDILNMFEYSTVLGIKKGSKVPLNPSMETIIEANDEIIVIASDDCVTATSENQHKIEFEVCLDTTKEIEREKEHLLILGKNGFLAKILFELNVFIAPGSNIKIASDDKNIDEEMSYLRTSINNIQIVSEKCNICDRTVLEKLVNEGFQHILILSDRDCDPEMSDAKTLLLLLNLRDISKNMKTSFSITSEMLDVRHQELARTMDVNDFVVSSNITSLMVSQISENRYLAPVFEDLLDSAGSEIYLKKVSNYIKIDEPVDFYTITYAVSKRGEIPIGFKKTIKGKDLQNKLQICINPVKSKKYLYTEEDYLIVLAEDG